MESSQVAVGSGRRRGLIVIAAGAAAAAVLSMMALSQDTAEATAKPAQAKNAASVTDLVPAAGSGVVPALPNVGSVANGVPQVVPALPKTNVQAPAAQPPAAQPPAAQPPAAAAACSGVDQAAAVFLQHFYAAHLQPSLGQQVADILNIDQYVKTHTVMIADMIKPSVDGSSAALTVFLQHVYAAHLETSLQQQVADIGNLDQYVKTHTVMIESMIKPLKGC